MHLVFDICTIAELGVPKGQNNTCDTSPPLCLFTIQQDSQISLTFASLIHSLEQAED